MPIIFSLVRSTCALLLLLLAYPAHAAGGNFIPLGERADQPAGFAELCAREREHCSEDGMQHSAAAPYEQAREIDLLRAVNRRVNEEVEQVTDRRRFGVAERWQLPNRVRPQGDCEDLALEKRQQLVAQGFPAGRLMLAVTYRRGIGLHTILVARTMAGDIVLDNSSERLLPWNQTSYVWLRVQAPGAPSEWHRVDQQPRFASRN